MLSAALNRAQCLSAFQVKATVQHLVPGIHSRTGGNKYRGLSSSSLCTRHGVQQHSGEANGSGRDARYSNCAPRVVHLVPETVCCQCCGNWNPSTHNCCTRRNSHSNLLHISALSWMLCRLKGPPQSIFPKLGPVIARTAWVDPILSVDGCSGQHQYSSAFLPAAFQALTPSRTNCPRQVAVRRDRWLVCYSCAISTRLCFYWFSFAATLYCTVL